MTTLVTITHDRIVTDSQTLAKTFGKRHKNVLRAFDGLQCSDEFRRLNFEPSEFLDARGKLQRSITMTKDGFAMLAMGFTGPKAAAFKEAFIKEFNVMAEALARGEQNLWQRLQAVIAQEAESAVKASFGSRLLLARKRELPRFRDQLAELHSQIQPSLLN
ncbi:Rha family transcriptional regulator [Massilia sp. YIM B02769]|uniref:Rha family transcriptional regulator n=1 Tax=Massilia sp. YIM B02769 TaxID=3050129 RepID=UPI0025B6E1C2|nr:Rha family transcriptional regulator [Massilia sp. YIM B02769]MDN4061127.1 Rha family transcriptional regulator [Massilia sp. YIM B02769]